MCPYGGRMVSGGAKAIWKAAELVVHTLLVETPRDGLVLVDTGLGLDDVRHPKERLGAGFVWSARPLLDEGHTARGQVERLGFDPHDVRHIVTTHLDLDHAGGLVDFPDASVHVHRVEKEAAIGRASMLEKERYRAVHFEHRPKWVLHEPGGDTWEGLASIQAVTDDILLVPLHGHTRGHCGVAVKDDLGWLLHCGDAYFFHEELDEPPRIPWGLGLYERAIAWDDRARVANQARLRELKNRGLRLLSAHDLLEYASYAGGSIIG